MSRLVELFRLVAGGALRAPGSLPKSVRCVVLTVITLALPSAMLAQTSLPEQKLSSDIWLHHFDPQIRAVGQSLFGVWGGGDTPPHQIDAASSSDGGATWTPDTSLPPIFGEFGARMPFALELSGATRLNLMTQNPALLYYGSAALSPSSWSDAVIVDDGSGYHKDARAISSAPAAPYIYFGYTELGSNYTNTVRFIRSLDNGATWTAPVVLSTPYCNGSSMVVAPDGTIFVSWVDYALGQVLLRKSTDHGATFSPAVSVAPILDNLNAKSMGWWIPYGIGQRFYPFYREAVDLYDSAPNFPALAVDRSNGPTRGWLYLTWADHAMGTTDPGSGVVVEQEQNDTAASAQLVSLGSDIQGTINTCCDGAVNDADFFQFDGNATESVVLDGDVGGPDQHFVVLAAPRFDGGYQTIANVGLPSAALLSAGAHAKPAIVTLPRAGRYLLYVYGGTQPANYTIRLRRFTVAASSLARDQRDIVLVRSTNGGATWSPKVRVNHDPAGADQSQPNVAVDGQGRVYVAWYDRRNAKDGAAVNAYASVSTDGGTTFGPDLRLSSVSSQWSKPGDATFPGTMVGDRIAIAAGDDYGMVAWTDLRNWPVASVYGARLLDVPTAAAAVSDLAAEPLASGAVRLRWRVNDARGLSAVEVVRRELDSDERLVGAATLSGTEGEASFDDATTEPGHAYAYRLRVTAGGRVDYLGPVAVAVPAHVTALACRATGANPFAEHATLTLAVPRAEAGVVRVYDVQGKVVRTLAEGRFAAGVTMLEWDGRDASGVVAAPGLYFVAAQVGGESARAKLTHVR